MDKKSNVLLSGIRKYKAGLTAAGIILFFQFVFYKNVLIGETEIDSVSYLNYRFRDFVELRPVNGRTPVYPFFLQGLRLLLGEGYALSGAVIVQIAVSLLSVVLLYRTIQKVTENAWGGVIAVLYGCSPFVLGWNALILTESFALSYVTAFLYLIVSYIKKPGLSSGLTVIFLTVFATFIKPALLPFDIALFLFWILRYVTLRGERRLLSILLAGSLLALGGILCYSAVVYQIWGTFALTEQGPRHLLASCLSSNLYQNYPDQEVVSQISQIYMEHNYENGYDTTTPIMDFLNHQSIDVWKFGTACVRADPAGYLKYLLGTAAGTANWLYAPAYNQFEYEGDIYFYLIELQNLLFSGLKMGHLYLIALAEGGIAAFQLFYRKQIAWIHFGIAALLTANFIYIYIGTYAEYMRSTIYLIPFAYLSMGMGIHSLLKAGGRQKKKTVRRI